MPGDRVDEVDVDVFRHRVRAVLVGVGVHVGLELRVLLEGRPEHVLVRAHVPVGVVEDLRVLVREGGDELEGLGLGDVQPVGLLDPGGVGQLELGVVGEPGAHVAGGVHLQDELDVVLVRPLLDLAGLALGVVGPEVRLGVASDSTLVSIQSWFSFR